MYFFLKNFLHQLFAYYFFKKVSNQCTLTDIIIKTDKETSMSKLTYIDKDTQTNLTHNDFIIEEDEYYKLIWTNNNFNSLLD